VRRHWCDSCGHPFLATPCDNLEHMNRHAIEIEVLIGLGTPVEAFQRDPMHH
jgi:hypothetical protein